MVWVEGRGGKMFELEEEIKCLGMEIREGRGGREKENRILEGRRLRLNE